MVVLIPEKTPARLKGELTLWMLQPKSGVYVGTMSAMVRERLWKKVATESGCGAAIMVYPCDNEQGFRLCSIGGTSRFIREIEGLQLVSRKKSV